MQAASNTNTSPSNATRASATTATRDGKRYARFGSLWPRRRGRVALFSLLSLSHHVPAPSPKSQSLSLSQFRLFRFGFLPLEAIAQPQNPNPAAEAHGWIRRRRRMCSASPTSSPGSPTARQSVSSSYTSPAAASSNPSYSSHRLLLIWLVSNGVVVVADSVLRLLLLPPGSGGGGSRESAFLEAVAEGNVRRLKSECSSLLVSPPSDAAAGLISSRRDSRRLLVGLLACPCACERVSCCLHSWLFRSVCLRFFFLPRMSLPGAEPVF